MKRPGVEKRIAAAWRPGGDRIREYLASEAEHEVVQRRIAILEERRSRSRLAHGGGMSVGAAANGAERRRRRQNPRAAVDEAIVRWWLRRLGGRSSTGVTTTS